MKAKAGAGLTPDWIVRRFFANNFSGCGFAASLAEKEKTISYLTLAGRPGDELAGSVDGFIDDLAEHDRVAVLVFPELASPADVVTLVLALSGAKRWVVNVEEAEGPYVYVGIRWRTASKRLSSVLGMAPIWTMPPVRRTPHVALALWPGEHKNPFNRPREAISFASAPPLTKTQRAYDKLMAKTKDGVARLNGNDTRPVALWRRVAFCLPGEYGAEIKRALT